MATFIVGGISDNGTKTPANQDACFAGVTKTSQGEVVFAVLCDGMGGCQFGELASATIIDEFRKWFFSKMDLGSLWRPDAYRTHIEWETILDNCNDGIRNYGFEHNLSIGSTVTLMLVTSEGVYTMNVGDTRAYSIGENMHRISTDDSVVGLEIQRGLLTEEQAKRDPRNNLLTQCIGFYANVSPHFSYEPTRKNTYLLATDGFYNKLMNDEIRELMFVRKHQSQDDLQVALNELKTRCRNRGEKDDISAIAISVQ